MNAARNWIAAIFSLIVLIALIYAYKWIKKNGASGVAQKTVEAVGDVLVGGVKGVASTVGITDTSTDQCQKDIAAGDTWNASFSCPAGTFIKNIFGKVFSTKPLQIGGGGGPE